jgi:hypothetical protein
MRTIQVPKEVSFVSTSPLGREQQLMGDDREVAGMTVSDADAEDVTIPAGMVRRYCGITKEFYYADPADEYCSCGHKIGAV